MSALQGHVQRFALWLREFWTGWWGETRFTDSLSAACNSQGTWNQPAVLWGLADFPGPRCAPGNGQVPKWELALVGTEGDTQNHGAAALLAQG